MLNFNGHYGLLFIDNVTELPNALFFRNEKSDAFFKRIKENSHTTIQTLVLLGREDSENEKQIEPLVFYPHYGTKDYLEIIDFLKKLRGNR